MKDIPIEALYVFIATAGGIVRALSEYKEGKPFKVSMLFASALIAGFSGNMFALMGITLGLGAHTLFMMAGVGGYLGEYALKLITDWVVKKIQ